MKENYCIIIDLGGSWMRKIICWTLVLVIMINVLAGNYTNILAKTNKRVTLSKKNVTLSVGKKAVVKLKNANMKVKWRVKNKKIAKVVNKKGKYDNSITIKGIKKGRTTLIAKCKKKSYKIKIIVKKKTMPKSQKSMVNTITTKKSEEKKSFIVAKEADYSTKTKLLSITYLVEKANERFEPAFCPGESGILEIKTKEGWESIPFLEGTSFAEYLIRFSKDGINIANINIGELYGDLVSGKYRYTIKFIVDSGTINVPVEFEVSNELKMEAVNNPVKISSDGTFVGIKIKNTTGKDYYTEYVFGKLERHDDGEWKDIKVDYFPTIEILGRLYSNTELEFRIGLDGKNGSITVDSDELLSGHYRYTHTVKGADGHTEDVSAEFDIIEGDQTPDKELDLKEKLKLEVTNSPVKLGDDMQIDVKISSLTKGIFRTGYEFGKLEILNGDKWKSVEIKDWYAITGLGNIQKDHPFIFSIGINTEKEKSNVYIDNLIPGHYRYSHLAEMGSNVYLCDEFDIVE